jgi:hypothetical protein
MKKWLLLELTEDLGKKSWFECGKMGTKDVWSLKLKSTLLQMPKLEWIFLGQYPMAVVRGAAGEDKEWHVALLCDERDDCSTLLGRMFGWEGLGVD